MRKRRADSGDVADADLCRGPGNLTRALGITLTDNLLDLVSSRLVIEDRGYAVDDVSWGPRIGIRVGTERRGAAGSRVIPRYLVECKLQTHG